VETGRDHKPKSTTTIEKTTRNRLQKRNNQSERDVMLNASETWALWFDGKLALPL
jgi:hypothetical protein